LFFRLQEVPLDFYERSRGQRAAALPDPIAMAYAIDPGVARRCSRGNLRMELAPGTLRGASVTVEGSRLILVHEIDKHRFDALLLRLGKLEKG
jgi:inosine-uridine nucleoside N-ribohydrolase